MSASKKAPKIGNLREWATPRVKRDDPGPAGTWKNSYLLGKEGHLAMSQGGLDRKEAKNKAGP